MSLEGELTIRLHWAAGRVVSVEIRSSRPVTAAKVLEGRTPEAALALLPRLFHVCGQAQAAAGARALEAARGEAADAGKARHRQLAVRLETLREHLLRMALDWPGFMGKKPAQEAAIRAMACYRNGLAACAASKGTTWPGADWAPLLEDLLGCPPEDWLALETWAHLRRWMRSSAPVPAYFRWVHDRGWSGIGACGVAPLPSLADAELAAAMADDRFLRFPRWRGRCHETGVGARVCSPLVAALRERWGNGLLTRLAARVTEATRLVRQDMGGTEEPSRRSHTGRVEAARGLLVHRITLRDDGTIAGYRILAPTEWNFHPEGVVARGLAGLGGTREAVAQQARQLIHAVDPCVAFRLELM